MLPEVARLFKTVGFPAAFGLVPALIPTPNMTKILRPGENYAIFGGTAMESPGRLDIRVNVVYECCGELAGTENR
jgi:hypothetical protein